MKSTHQFVDPDTKATIARVAAEYALYEGLDSVTPAAVAEGAGASLEDFHACYCTVEEALTDFLITGLKRLDQRSLDLPDQASMLEKAEQIVIDGVREGEAEVYTLPSLIRLRQQIDTFNPGLGQSALEKFIRNFGSEARGNARRLTEFEYEVRLRLIIEATETAMSWYYNDPNGNDPEVGVNYVRTAFRMIAP